MDELPTDILCLIASYVRFTNVLRAVCRRWWKIIPPSAPNMRSAHIFDRPAPPGMPRPIAIYDLRKEFTRPPEFVPLFFRHEPGEHEVSSGVYRCDLGSKMVHGKTKEYTCEAYKCGQPFLNCVACSDVSPIQAGRLAYFYTMRFSKSHVVFDSPPDCYEVLYPVVELPKIFTEVRAVILRMHEEILPDRMLCERLAIDGYARVGETIFPNLRMLLVDSNSIRISRVNFPKLRHLAVFIDDRCPTIDFHVEELLVCCRVVNDAKSLIEAANPTALTIICNDARNLAEIRMNPLIFRLRHGGGCAPRSPIPGYIKSVSAHSYKPYHLISKTLQSFIRMLLIDVTKILFSDKN